VFDLAQMTLAQAEALITSRAGEACVRLSRRADGAMMFADCEVGARGVRERRLARVAMVALVAATTWAAAHVRPPSRVADLHTRFFRAPGGTMGVHFVHELESPPEGVPMMGELVPVSSARGVTGS
jgi:hypothetical protein